MNLTRHGTLPHSLLGVWAHPDDEAYLSAGLMASMRAAGRRVVVATATRGERGAADPVAWPPHRLAPLRERELSASLAAVGVQEHHWLPYQDGTLADVDPASGAADVRDLIDRIRPAVVVTFGPDGMTGHPDHRAVSHWVARACADMAAPPRIWHATQTPDFHRAWGELNDAVGIWMDRSCVPSTPANELVWSLPHNHRLRAAKFAALRAHASQTAGLISLVGESTYRAWWSGEYFVRAVNEPSTRHTAFAVASPPPGG
jgi:LmbE family N-acetylglucosaminyl deacetylase